jgi:hypothetical protein
MRRSVVREDDQNFLRIKFKVKSNHHIAGRSQRLQSVVTENA